MTTTRSLLLTLAALAAAACTGTPTPVDPAADAGPIDAGTTDAGAIDAGTPDAGSVGGTKAVGEACASAAECAGGDRAACGQDKFGYKDGYCFLEGCASNTDCPDGSHCAYGDAESGTKGLCFKDCTKNSDCRADGYLCLDLDADDARECESGATGTAAIGAACTRIYECGGGADGYCVTETADGSFKGGYCSKYCEKNADCGAGAHCGYMVDGSGSCLADCASDGACRGSGWTCSDADFDDAKECDVFGATPVGGACSSDVDCSGGSNRTCKAASGGVLKGGYCSIKYCSATAKCPAGSHCGFVDENSEEGICLADCADKASCRGDGYDCVDADSDETNECWALSTGTKAVGEACAGNWDCAGGAAARCLLEGGGTYRSGYCTTNCDTTHACAAGSHCSTGACVKDCAADGDCRADGYRCYDADGDASKECEAAGTGSSKVGSPCTGVWECVGAEKAYCYGAQDGFPGGYCFVAPCKANTDCPTGSHCADKNANGNGRCLANCAAASECRTDYVCIDRDSDDAKECVGG